MLSPRRVPGYTLHQLRASKRRGRMRRRFCGKIGHGPWYYTASWSTIGGKLVDSDRGEICSRCGVYKKEVA